MIVTKKLRYKEENYKEEKICKKKIRKEKEGGIKKIRVMIMIRKWKYTFVNEGIDVKKWSNRKTQERNGETLLIRMVIEKYTNLGKEN